MQARVAHKKNIEITAGYYLQKMKPPHDNDDDMTMINAPCTMKTPQMTPNNTV